MTSPFLLVATPIYGGLATTGYITSLLTLQTACAEQQLTKPGSEIVTRLERLKTCPLIASATLVTLSVGDGTVTVNSFETGMTHRQSDF
jgi:hypothetical protein